MATTFMTISPVSPFAALGEIVSQQRFRDVCTKGEKWFHRRRIVSSRPGRRNIQVENANDCKAMDFRP